MKEADREAVLARLASDAEALTTDERLALLGDLQQLRSWQDAREAALLAVCHSERDDVTAGARDIAQLCQQEANVPYAEATRRSLRATWFGELPAVGRALAAGRIGTAQADEVCTLAESLEAHQRPELAAAVDDVIDKIAPLTPARTRRHLKEFQRSLDTDDGEDRLAKQRRDNALRFRRQSDGTTAFSGQLDPISAEYLRNAIDAKVTEMWRNEGKRRHDTAAPDRVLSNEQRRARALVELVRAGAATDPATRGRAEIVVMIDHRTLLGQLSAEPTARLASGEALPAAEARRLACDADILPVMLGGASQPLDVGRRTRLATPAQRVALRAVHETCCIAGCDVPFDWCEIHHITWWRHGGHSDLDNLAPVCSKHHHLIHDDRWVLTLDQDRVGRLTERRPEATGDPMRPAPTRRPGPERSPHPETVRSVSKPPRQRAGSTERLIPMRC